MKLNLPFLLIFTWVTAASVRAAESVPTPFRTTSGRFGLLVKDMATPAGLRVYVDQDDSPAGWTEWGFDQMAEGLTVYRYPPGAREWKWEPEGAVIFAAHSNQLAVVLPNVETRGRLRWMAEWYDDQWRVIRRFPEVGVLTQEGPALSLAPPWLDPPVPDIAELMRWAPTSLSRRLSSDYQSMAWQPVEPTPSWPSLELPGLTSPAPLVVAWTDARTGRALTLEPEQGQTDGNRMRWLGRLPNGASWSVVADERTSTGMTITAWVEAEQDFVFRLSLGLAVPETAWVWYDDMQFNAPMQPGGRYSLDAPSPYGLAQRRSYYPFGVIASDQSMVVAETDGREPRHLLIEADADERRLWIHYDLAATPETRHFPGMAAVRARFRTEARAGVQPFRAALEHWYQMDPDWRRSRVPRHGLWMPFTDIGSVSGAMDFGFAFYEKVGSPGPDLDHAREAGALNLIYTEPWLYWLPLGSTSEWNRASAVQRMQERAQTAVGRDREFASAGLLGATRDQKLQPRIQFLATPWSTGARMEVNTDPELPVTKQAPVNRAMAEWRFIREVLTDPRADGIYLDSMSAMESIDYHPAALAVADYPATFVLADLKPGVAMPIQAVEFTAALSRYLHEQGRYLMANFPCWRFPFFMPYLDIPGEETTWYSGRQYTPMNERERNYRRAMSGAKPFGFLQAAHFSELGPTEMENYFRDCLALGLLPSFFSHDGANDPYWVDASLYERDRALFRRYLPLIIHLSEAGWQPVPKATFTEPAVQVEQFGSLSGPSVWITVRNPKPNRITGQLSLSSSLTARVAYAVDTGVVNGPGEPGPTLELEPGGVAVWLLVKPDALTAEAAWFRQHAARHEQYRAGVVNLLAAQRQRTLGMSVTMAPVGEVTFREPVRLKLTLETSPDSNPAQFRGWKVRGVPPAEIDLPPGSPVTIDVPSSFEVRAGQWNVITWKIQADGQDHELRRMYWPPSKPGLVYGGPDGRWTVTDSVADLVFSASNCSTRARRLNFQAQGEGLDEHLDTVLDPAASTQIIIRVASGHAQMQRVQAHWESDGRRERSHEVFVIFAPRLEHRATGPGVRVTADSLYSGYSTAPLHDGVVETAGLVWYEAAYASAETADPHWIRVQFPEPVSVSSATAHWNAEGGVRFVSNRGQLWGRRSDGSEVRLGAFDHPSTGSVTRIEFPSTEVTDLEWRQPSSGGSAARPDLLWLVELEVQ